MNESITMGCWRLTCCVFWGRLVRFDAVGETHLSFHTHWFASVVFTLSLLHVDFNRVERHVGTELGDISGPEDIKQSCQLLKNSVRRWSVHKEQHTDACRAEISARTIELISKLQPTVQETQLPAARSYLNSKPLGRWSFHTASAEPLPGEAVGEGLPGKLNHRVGWSLRVEFCRRLSNSV